MRCFLTWHSRNRWAVIVVLFAAVSLGTACVPDQRRVMLPPSADGWAAGQILDASTGHVVAFDQWLARLSTQEIVYLGEEHHNQHHISAALKLLNGLLAAGIRPVLGMEMFGWDGQRALNAYLEDPRQDRTALLDALRWKQNWGGPFEDYEPLVAFSAEHHLAVHAMNPPKTLIRQVAREGLTHARQGSEWMQWGMQSETIIDDPAYRSRILDQLQRCHGGGTDDDYRTMYEASMVRDEGMARTLAAVLQDIRRDSGTPRRMVLSYTGGGHIQYNLPVPKRVARRFTDPVRATTVYLAAYDPGRAEEIRELLRDGIADFVWLTPPGRQGAPQRCR